MRDSTTILEDFIEPIVEITAKADLAEIKKVFQSGKNQLVVVVDERRSPLGVIYAQDLLAKCLQAQENNQNLEKIFNKSTVKTLIKPVISLSASLSFMEYYTKLWKKNKAIKENCCVLVNSQNQLLGKLNQQKILEVITLHNLPEQNLLTILNKFPLPVMLKTDQGEILAQNQEWRQKIGNFVPVQDNLTTKYLQKTSLSPTPISTIISKMVQPLNNTIATQPETSQWEFCQVALDQLNSVTNDQETEKSVWLIFANDLSKQQQLSTELATKEINLVELNQLTDEFVSCISHDLKSPITAILGLASLLQEQKLGKLNQRQSDYVNLIYQSGRKMMTLVNELLELTRLETGELQLSNQVIETEYLCKQIYQQVEKELTAEKLKFCLEIPSNLKVIRVDPLRVSQMLIHLLDNAIKSSKPGDTIGLRVNRWQNSIAFTVWDTGIGIPTESQRLIWHKSPSLDRTLGSQINYKNLGLILTQRLAQIHGGNISFLSQEGKGSEFTILLPQYSTTTAKKTKKTKDDSATAYPIVLLVEIIPQEIEELNSLLQSLDYRVVIARSGTEAVEKASQLKPHCILLNSCLPFLSSWEVLTLLKSEPETESIPVILTTKDSESNQVKAPQADAILTFPLETEVLAATLANPKAVTKLKKRNLTILYIYPESASLSFNDTQLEWLESRHTSGLIHRILEADNLEQAELLARVWEVDVIVFNSLLLKDPQPTLTQLSNLEKLARLPIITLDDKTSKIANKISGLQIFPCLNVSENKNIDDLLQVIEIALGLT